MSRRAELQKKLASAPAPKPPADLAERIKREIPDNLRFNAEEERERFASSIALNLRVAASFLVLVATAFLALRIVSSRTPMAEKRPRMMKEAQRVVSTAEPPATAVVATEEPLPSPPPKPVVAKRAAKTTKRSSGGQPPTAVLDSGGPLSSIGKTDIAEAKPVSPPPPPPAAVAAPAPVQPSFVRVTAAAPSSANRASLKTETPHPTVAVDDAMIQRSAAPPSMPHGIVLDVEAAAQPLVPGDVVLRASFDCGAVVHDLRVDVLLSPEVATTQRWLAMSWRWGTSEFAGNSRTTLVEFAMPNAADAPLATVRAQYRTDNDPAEQSVERLIRRSDVVTWTFASRRMKAATLAALWAHRSADRAQIANAARAAGLEDLAAEVEKER